MAPLLEESPLAISVAQAAAVLDEIYGLHGEIRPLVGDRDRNFAIRNSAGQWMLKIANPAEKPQVLEAQQEVLQHCRHWDPDLPLADPVSTRDGSLVSVAQIAGTEVPVRLTTFVPGATVEEVGWGPTLRLDGAALLARLDLALRGFIPKAIGAPDEWQIDRLAGLRSHTQCLPGDRRSLAAGWLDYYEEHVHSRLSSLRMQAIHGDFNPANLIVASDDPERIAGIIDFGDMTVGPLVADPAIYAAYQSLGTLNPAASIAAIAASFHRAVPLTGAEVELFGPLAVSRLVQSLIISSWRATLHPENRDYILLHAEPIWSALQRLDPDNPAQLTSAVADACATSAPVTRDSAGALAARRSVFSPGMRLSYDRPLRIRSARGVWLTDADDVRYLDAYNNVPHIGHSHPEVVAALALQAGRLNTNTRYLVDEVTDYATRLVSLLPPSLDTVMFANSGSEANDLAWRIARTVTGRRGIVVTDHAYHGATELTINCSPEETGIDKLPSWVATVPPPSAPDCGSGEVAAAIDQLRRMGHDVAAFACDTVFSSDGIYDPPLGYLKSVYSAVRSCGGLCIADEVQAGFGRVGSRFWGFAGDAAVPDIVTLGKPMGNGHPLAAVVTSSAIADEFSRSGYYFSTFAGNPVAAAAGQAVLDVIEREDLPGHADAIGDYLRIRLAEMLGAEERVFGVRGVGLFVGIDVADTRGEPDATAAHYLQNGMRERQVLVGRTGPGGNVLKIRPPLIFGERHADLLLATLEETLAGCR